jgi:transcription initiation factor TFIIE subunit beta
LIDFKFRNYFRVEKKILKESSKSASTSKKSLQPWESKVPKEPKEPMNYKTMSGSSNKRFAILTKIVNYMKDKHLSGDDQPITIEEILDETNQLDIGSSTKTVRELIIMMDIHLSQFTSSG